MSSDSRSRFSTEFRLQELEGAVQIIYNQLNNLGNMLVEQGILKEPTEESTDGEE